MSDSAPASIEFPTAAQASAKSIATVEAVRQASLHALRADIARCMEESWRNGTLRACISLSDFFFVGSIRTPLKATAFDKSHDGVDAAAFDKSHDAVDAIAAELRDRGYTVRIGPYVCGSGADGYAHESNEPCIWVSYTPADSTGSTQAQ